MDARGFRRLTGLFNVPGYPGFPGLTRRGSGREATEKQGSGNDLLVLIVGIFTFIR